MRKSSYLLLFAVVLMAASFSACELTALAGVSGSGPIVPKEYNLSGFDAVEVSHAFTVVIEQGDRFQVTVKTHENLMKYLEVKVEGGTLHVGFEGLHSLNNTDGEVYVRMPKLRAVGLSGACEAELRGNWQAESFSVDLSGASELKGQITAGEAKLECSGASSLELAGSAKTAAIDGSGASKFHLEGFTTGDLHIELSGASHAEAVVNGRLDADLSGASSLHYGGNPTLGSMETSGASSLKRMSK
jgi:hypothetical protein